MAFKIINNKIIKDNEGAALLMTLLILSSVLVVALATADLVMVGIKMSRNQVQSTRAFFAAEAGVERSLWKSRKDSYDLPDSDTENVFSGTLGNEATYQVNYSTTTPEVMFTSTGDYRQVKRTISVSFFVN